MKKGELRNFAKFAGKHLFQTVAQVFPVNFAKFLRKPFSQNAPARLLLN